MHETAHGQTWRADHTLTTCATVRVTCVDATPSTRFQKNVADSGVAHRPVRVHDAGRRRLKIRQEGIPVIRFRSTRHRISAISTYTSSGTIKLSGVKDVLMYSGSSGSLPQESRGSWIFTRGDLEVLEGGVWE
ncbi:hypothetical protein Bbelb_268160 [Branchiostoma belcheri]|nr:hypothetical protein Bbelb_268160 [Branchiostoma belcheri]